ncbi:ABC transporter ATP-binding protein [Paenibacillus psychroresistens]|nr:ABC transporter ATP-binding protein [Paenibacillus psychroresistens]
MAQLELKNINYTYPGQQHAALTEINLSVKEGEFVVVCGQTGSGKSSLLKLMKPELLPAGELTGNITFAEKQLSSYKHIELSQNIGMVMQNPESQIVMDRVMEELIFSMENVGISPLQMRKRIAEIAQFFNLEPLLTKSIIELSGGQRQMINLAAVMVLQPKVLLLDEPTAQLDPVAAREFLQLVRRVNEEFGITVLMAEHRLEDVWPLADQICLMENGEIKAYGTPDQLIHSDQAEIELYLPPVGKLFRKLGMSEGSLLSIKDAKLRFASWHADLQIKLLAINSKQNSSMLRQEPPILTCKDIYFQYGKKANPILQHVTLDIHAGDFLTIFGANGSGKSTLLQILCGLLKEQSGEVLFEGKAVKRIEETLRYTRFGYLSQNPVLHFTEETVEKELNSAAERALKLNIKVDLAQTIDEFELSELLQQHPYDLSGGEKQKLALGCILMMKPSILFLDEPTKGLDPRSKEILSQRLNKEQSSGKAIVMVSHDIEFAAAHANRCAMLFDGRIVADAEPAGFFSGNYFYTTAINRLVRDWYPNAITDKDVVELCGLENTN